MKGDLKSQGSQGQSMFMKFDQILAGILEDEPGDGVRPCEFFDILPCRSWLCYYANFTVPMSADSVTHGDADSVASLFEDQCDGWRVNPHHGGFQRIPG